MKFNSNTTTAIAILTLAQFLSACDGGHQDNSDKLAKPATAAAAGDSSRDLRGLTISNKAAYIPAQCYTKPVDAQGKVSNPCYICHTQSQQPNYLDDGDTQTSYGFPEDALNNHWSNPFVNRMQAIAAISDPAIDRYVQTSNYFDAQGQPILAQRLAQVPAGWDDNRNGRWDGYVPDVWFHFDNAGFDRSPDGGYNGWRAFAYFPVPGAFMPSNGSTDDVMIRLPEAYRQNISGQFDVQVYKANLAITEAMIRRGDVAVESLDEKALGQDLDGDGKLAIASRVHYDWAPLQGRYMHWVGKAASLDKDAAPMAAGLFPLGTEFLHSVRYLAEQTDHSIGLAPRMKELRYAVKTSWRTYYQLQENALKDEKERHDYPDRLKRVVGDIETGVRTNLGWRYQAFIEAADGTLRPQTYEELVTCNGCHSGIGATTDGAFAFPRKLAGDSFQGGWYHWSQKGLAGLADPLRQDGQGEYAFYLRHNPWGNAFRNNVEVHDRFFAADGQPRADAFAALAKDINHLLQPSLERARQLNKAYKVLVDAQAFAGGRDAFLQPADTLQREVEQDGETGIKEVLGAR